ncbi:MAG: DNA-binding protein [Bacteroidaceae bacterium]|nr:DNA-binding protein [Bacteroidaceae bacterium]
MVRYILKQIKISSSRAYGKWFAKNVVEETVDLDGLAGHMSSHNSVYSKGVIKGLLTDMIGCIKELLLEGKNVKIDDLAIFSLGIKNKLTADTEEAFTVTKNIEGVKLRARATGELMSKSLKLDATLKRAKYINGKLATEGEGGSDPNPDNSLTPTPSPEGEGSQNGGEGGNTGGNDNGGNSGGSGDDQN